MHKRFLNSLPCDPPDVLGPSSETLQWHEIVWVLSCHLAAKEIGSFATPQCSTFASSKTFALLIGIPGRPKRLLSTVLPYDY
jgi:hypothetical protein